MVVKSIDIYYIARPFSLNQNFLICTKSLKDNMPPTLSIAIPTYNRAELLSYCIERIMKEFQGKSIDFEIVVSDNVSTDHTAIIVAEKIANGYPVKYYRKNENSGAFPNYYNVYRRCTGDYIIWLADDDSIDSDQVLKYVDLLNQDETLVGIYTDWMAYDDNSESELHRYWPQIPAMEFSPDQKHLMVDHIIQNQLLVEQGIFRRKEFIKAYVPYQYGFPYYYWLYNLSGQGKLRFDPEPFYKENRVLKPQFDRGSHWSNKDLAFLLIGDQMRIAIESLFFQLLSDYPWDHYDSKNRLLLVNYIDGWLHRRTTLEIARAIARSNWILAVELRRRQIMKDGNSNLDKSYSEFIEITLPASIQAIHEIHKSIDDKKKLVFYGFHSTQIHDLFHKIFPDAEVVSLNELTLFDHPEEILLISKSSKSDFNQHGIMSGQIIDFTSLIECYRLSKIDPGWLHPL